MRHSRIWTSIRPVIFTCLLLAITPLKAWDLFTHAGMNLPSGLEHDGPWYMKIDSREKWASFWLDLIPPGLDPDLELWDVPGIDFDNYYILAAGLGTVPTGGYDIHVSKVIDVGNELYIYAR